jgi:hypothetical protein
MNLYWVCAAHLAQLEKTPLLPTLQSAGLCHPGFTLFTWRFFPYCKFCSALYVLDLINISQLKEFVFVISPPCWLQFACLPTHSPTHLHFTCQPSVRGITKPRAVSAAPRSFAERAIVSGAAISTSNYVLCPIISSLCDVWLLHCLRNFIR